MRRVVRQGDTPVPSSDLVPGVTLISAGTAWIPPSVDTGAQTTITGAPGHGTVVVNPDGSYGLKSKVFTVTQAAAPPPVVTSVAPSSVVESTAAPITISGNGSSYAANGSLNSTAPRGGASNRPIRRGTNAIPQSAAAKSGD